MWWFTRALTEEQFVAHIAKAIGRATDLSPRSALGVAERAYFDFRCDNRARFGNRKYHWDKSAAETLAQEYVLEYAEKAP